MYMQYTTELFLLSVSTALILLLKDPGANVRAKAAEAMSLLCDY
ncbi:hypothetical protein ACOMHN_027279 [Nucella lapillus]